MRRTKEQAAQTKMQILEAAEELFLESGYDNVSLEAIASKANSTCQKLPTAHWRMSTSY